MTARLAEEIAGMKRERGDLSFKGLYSTDVYQPK
jgi:hypothetical protein